jgi:hypothetical protein
MAARRATEFPIFFKDATAKTCMSVLSPVASSYAVSERLSAFEGVASGGVVSVAGDPTVPKLSASISVLDMVVAWRCAP